MTDADRFYLAESLCRCRMREIVNGVTADADPVAVVEACVVLLTISFVDELREAGRAMDPGPGPYPPSPDAEALKHVTEKEIRAVSDLWCSCIRELGPLDDCETGSLLFTAAAIVGTERAITA